MTMMANSPFFCFIMGMPPLGGGARGRVRSLVRRLMDIVIVGCAIKTCDF